MPNLAAVDWLVLLLFLFFAISTGLGLKAFVAESKDYLQAGRTLPAWLCGLAFCAVGLGSQAAIGMGAAGARYGLASAGFYIVGAIPAMLFTGLFLMPVYYGSQARTLPEFLRLRFDRKTGALNALLTLATTVLGTGISLYALAHILRALHVFDTTFNALHLQPHGYMLTLMAVPAAVVLVYVLLGGLTAAMYNQVLQFFAMTAGFLPLTLLSVKQAGGWSGVKMAAAGLAQGAGGGKHAGLGAMALAAGLGLALGASTWCTEFRVVQTAMAARNLDAARRAPLIAAAVWLLAPLLLIVPGMIAIGMPTPHTSVTVRNENGTIYHEITVVPQAAEAGRGLVPAQTDSTTDPLGGKPRMDANGHALLNYEMALPSVLTHFLPTGLLGLGLAALLASLMSGVAANAMAFAAVLTCDVYQPRLGKQASDGRLLAVSRWAAAGAIAAGFAAACAAAYSGWKPEGLATLLVRLSMPLLATFLAGIFWKRTTGHGAFAGLVAGLCIAAALPRHATGGLEQNLWAALAALGANLMVTVAVSLATQPRVESELGGLVYGLTPKAKDAPGRMRPEKLAILILAAALALGLMLAM